MSTRSKEGDSKTEQHNALIAYLKVEFQQIGMRFDRMDKRMDVLENKVDVLVLNMRELRTDVTDILRKLSNGR